VAWSNDPARAARARALYARDIDAAKLVELATAHGHYLWFTDCNRWTVERLAKAGLARGGLGVIFSGQVARHLIGFHRVNGQ